MINQRKKRKDIKDDLINLDFSSSSSSSGTSLGKLVGNSSVDAMSTGNFNDPTKRRIQTLFDKQVSTIQDQANQRADAEESNLDILDRGSRYTRKNEKLKKFKV